MYIMTPCENIQFKSRLAWVEVEEGEEIWKKMVVALGPKGWWISF